MLLYISLFTILISLILLYNTWNVNRNSIFLFLFFILISIYGITHYFTIYEKNVFFIAFFYNNFSPYFLLLGPFLYLYVRNTITDKQGLKKADYLHFIPATIHFIGIIPYYLLPFSHKTEVARSIIENIDNLSYVAANFFFTPSIGYAIRAVLFLIYILACLRILWQFSKTKNLKITNITNTQAMATYRWLVLFVNSLLLIWIYILVLTYLSVESKPSIALKTSYPLLIVSGISYCLMSFSLLLFPTILYGFPKVVGKNKKPIIVIKRTTIPTKNVDLMTLFNEEDPFYEIALSIKTYLITKQPFLKTNFSQYDISIDLKIPLNHISYCLNTIFNKKFTLLKTELRIEHAKYLLKSEYSKSMTIDAVAQKCGFNTRSNFYNAFKLITNRTPAEFINEYEEVHKKPL